MRRIKTGMVKAKEITIRKIHKCSECGKDNIVSTTLTIQGLKQAMAQQEEFNSKDGQTGRNN